MVKVGINGFGRIGRLILRAILENYRNEIKVVAINDLGSIETNAHLIKYDSTHGIIKEEINTSNEGYISEKGELERWVGGINSKKFTKEIKKYTKKTKEKFEKELNESIRSKESN